MCMSFIAAGAVSGSVPSSLQQVSHNQLSDADQLQCLFGMGKQGDIVLMGYSNLLYMYANNGIHHTQKWAKEFPAEIGSVCDICINSHGDLFLKNYTNENNPTICCNNNLQKQYSLRHKGRLIDSVDGELFYLEKFGHEQNKIVVHKDHSVGPTSHQATSQKVDLSQPLTLQHQWKGMFCDPSVCHVQQYYVVVERMNKALDVFDLKGLFVSLDQFCWDGLRKYHKFSTHELI